MFRWGFLCILYVLFWWKKSEECYVLKSVLDFVKWNIIVENCDFLLFNFRFY